VLLSGRQKSVSLWNPPCSLGPVRIGVFEVDFATRELWKHGIKIKLHGQPFKVLSILLEHPGQVVTRQELSRRLWEGDTFVDFEHSLATAISKIREALADSPRYVETLPRRGYRFIAEATVVSGGSVNKLAPAAGDPRQKTMIRLRL
jgi:DNA-binding winged helix-turn-helix (wHTH) protein